MAIIHLGISLGFSTASEIPVQTITAQAQKVGPWKPATLQIEYVNDQTINALFETVADVVESIFTSFVWRRRCLAVKGGRLKP